MPALTLRARKILHAVVSEYLQTGEAVGSRTVTRRHGIDLSAATVRNVMADLAELGLLDQPHTSAGRVPTEAGLRFFIDSLLTVRSLSPKEKEAIRERYGDLRDFEELLQQTSRLLSEITTHAGLVMLPSPERERFRQLEFVPLKNRQVLCVMVTSSGRIDNKLFSAEFALEPGRLERIHNYLNQLLGGLTLDEMRRRVVDELGQEKNRYDDLVAEALRLGHAALGADDRAGAEVIVSGKANLLDPAQPGGPDQVQRTRDLLQALEDKELLVRLLDRTLRAERVQVFLGAETASAALAASSVVATPYGPEDQPLGAIAVIGPKRMNYGKVMSIVDFTADLVTRLIEGGE
jgi:heat-inducible transcriptional repressor